MQIVSHIGLHCTDEDALLKSLSKNRDALARRKILLPNPGKYRPLIRETIADILTNKGLPPTREAILSEIAGRADPERIVLSNRNFICVPNRIFENGVLYGLADPKLAIFGELFAEDEIEIMMAIRDPASFIPAAFAQSSGRSFDSFLSGIQPDQLYWSDLIDRILDAIPDVKLTVWCNEDTPIIWPHLLRAMAGLKHTDKITGGYDLISQVLTSDGVKGLQAYFTKNPPKSEAHRVKVLAAFMQRFSREEAMLEEIDMPNWTENLMDQLSDAYDEDVEDIAARDDIRFISPTL